MNTHQILIDTTLNIAKDFFYILNNLNQEERKKVVNQLQIEYCFDCLRKTENCSCYLNDRW